MKIRRRKRLARARKRGGHDPRVEHLRLAKANNRIIGNIKVFN